MKQFQLQVLAQSFEVELETDPEVIEYTIIFLFLKQHEISVKTNIN